MVDQDLIDRFITFYQDFYHEKIETLAQHYPDRQRSLYIPYDELYQFDSDLAEDFRTNPDEMQRNAEEALRLSDLPVDANLDKAHIRVTELPENIGISEIRVQENHIGELISFQGVVRKATDVRPKITEAAFQCQRCGTMTYLPQDSSGFQEPTECQGCETSGAFRINLDQSEMIDSQELRIQASPTGVGTDETPQSIEVDLTDDLCGQVTPGDHVTVVGVLRGEQLETGNSKTSLVDLYVDGTSITPNDGFDTEITDSDKREIIDIAGREDIYELFINSVAPGVNGLEEEKLSVLLQLFGGVTKETQGGELIRGQPHILFLGDPAVGLSRLLRSAARLAPRSTYTNAAETSKAGLTAAAARTAGTDSPWELEAGALPISDRGLAAIDNFSKLNNDALAALSEPLEQQQITISKASIHESIDTRVGILAAGGPESGRFDMYEPLGDQFPIDAQLISQFDLIFTLSDSPNPETDQQLAEHILEINKAGELRQTGADPEIPDSADAPLNASIIRKYIAHAREVCFPVISEEAKEIIEEFYVDLRSKGADENAPVPATARKLEAMVRLSEASARVRLSDTIEREDAKRATDIVGSSLKDIGVDPETGQFDADVVETGTSKSQRDRIKNIKDLIADIEGEYQEGAPVDEVLDRAGEIGMDRGKAKQEIEKLRTKGEVYEQVDGYFRTA